MNESQMYQPGSVLAPCQPAWQTAPDELLISLGDFEVVHECTFMSCHDNICERSMKPTLL